MEGKFFLSPRSDYGRKRRFGLSGAINLIITNGILQILIYSNIFNLGFCTLTSQLFNLAIGYWLYSKIVFNVKGIKNIKLISKYICLSGCLWLLNWIGIELIYELGLNMNIAALMMIFPLAMLSFFSQKYLIFKK